MFTFKSGVPLILVAAVVSIISTSIPYWISIDFEVGRAHGGLWQTCVTVESTTSCTSLGGDVASWFDAVRALNVIGVICVCMGAVFACMFARTHTNRTYVTCAIALAFFAGMCMAISAIIFGVKEKEASSSFGAGFWLNIVGVVLALVSGGLLVVAKNTIQVSSGYSSF